MSIQVQFNEIELSILSIPRSKLWIFTSSILQLLYGLIDEEGLKICQESNEVRVNSGENESRRGAFGGVSGDGNDSERRGSIKKVDNTSKTSHELAHSTSVQRASGNSDFSNNDNNNNNNNNNINNSNDDDDDDSFIHIALTPNECTIICSSRLLQKFFPKPLEICHQLDYTDVQLLPSRYVSLIVYSDGGYDKSSRILEMTKPLSENNISVFYISSHFNDIVLIPFDLKEKVIQILSKQGFEYSEISNAYISNHCITNLEKPLTCSFEKTFHLFASANIHPKIDECHELLLTGSRKGEFKNSILKVIKVFCLANSSSPAYFAITRTLSTELSLILPRSTKVRLQYGFDSTNLIGSTQDVVIPISMDFSNLPLNCAGLVAGLANKLITDGENSIDISYLSMARSGVIMIPQENLALARESFMSI